MRPGAAVIAAGSGYEAVAILTGRMPTWTAMVRTLPRPARVAVCTSFSAWLFVHMLREVVEAKS